MRRDVVTGSFFKRQFNLDCDIHHTVCPPTGFMRQAAGREGLEENQPDSQLAVARIDKGSKPASPSLVEID